MESRFNFSILSYKTKILSSFELYAVLQISNRPVLYPLIIHYFNKLLMNYSSIIDNELHSIQAKYYEFLTSYSVF